MARIQEPPPTPPWSKIYIKIDREVEVVFCVVNTLGVGFPWGLGAFPAALVMTVRLGISSPITCNHYYQTTIDANTESICSVLPYFF